MLKEALEDMICLAQKIVIKFSAEWATKKKTSKRPGVLENFSDGMEGL